jgi:N-acetylneuraminic acid mutarotase
MVLTAGLLHSAEMRWKTLPDLPQALGGQFVGVIGDELIVAGGSYWTAAPWANGAKHWTGAVYALKREDKFWRPAGKLPQPLAYGAAVNIKGGMILFGGQTPSDFSPSVLLLAMQGGLLRTKALANLPRPLAMSNAVIAGDTVYLLGGQPSFTPTKALNLFLAISLKDLLAAKPAWKELPSWSGPARFFAQAADGGDAVYLAGGTDLIPGPDGTPVRKFLNDAHRYTPARGWEKLPDMPRPAQAGLAMVRGGRFFVFGGSDGTLSEELRDRHPGFRLDILMYDPKTRAWSEAGRIPTSLVTTGMTLWRGQYIIAGGEDRPGHRSAAVVAAEFKSRKP